MKRKSKAAQGAHDRFRVSLPGFVVLATSMFLLVGLGAVVATQITGQSECSRMFVQGSGMLLLILLALFEFSLARMVVAQFSEEEALRPAWFMIMLSGGCHLVAALCMKIAAILPGAPPAAVSADTTAAAVYRFGLIVGGPLQMVLMAAGLFFLLRTCRKSKLPVRMSWGDCGWLAAAVADAWIEMSHLTRGLTAFDALRSSGGPLLVVLLIEAILVRRYMSAMGEGMIAKSWMSITAAIFLTALQQLALQAVTTGLLPAPLADITWYIWFLAAMTYALGPAWQIEAIQSACGKVGVTRFSPFASSLRALRLIKVGS